MSASNTRADVATISPGRKPVTLINVFTVEPANQQQLLELTHIDSMEVYDRSIDTQIMRLRRKIEADPAAPRFIRTERGTGYYFDAPVSAVR